ncbi:MAG: glycoside hydrolase family 20 protein [Lewinella sp.]|uniref:glycoside hydrolase family 20 protein n=1 Tax=Lewinella sp. TaxID=2004506 RepID=UPI003D6BB67A
MFRYIFLSFCMAVFVQSCSPVATDLENSYAVIPLPQSVVPQQGQFIINEATTVFVEGQNEGVDAVVQQFVEQMNASNDLTLTQGESEGDNQIVFQLATTIEAPEGYHLSITPQQVSVQAATAKGIFYAVQSLRQLLSFDAQSEGVWFFPCAEIEDEPRFSYRGMHLDVARHFYPVESVKKIIDQLAYHKMNTFHWHLTDDQGWRIEIKKYPKLTEVGAFRNGTLVGHYNDEPHQFDGQRYGGFYTQEEIKEVIRYAEERFVQVIPEIELPGHAQAALAAYPELACTEGPFEVWQKWGVSENIFCPTEATFTFLENVLAEVAGLFPGKYIHIGGDECPKSAWENSAFCQQLMKEQGLKDEHELQSYFIRRIEAFLNEKGKQIIGWDEILEGGLAPNATIMSWRGIEGGIEAANADHDVIMTPTSHCYLDYYQSDHPDEPLAIGGLTPLEKVYGYNPIPEELPASQHHFILGAQANVWTEYIITQEKLEYMIFPRLCALAEVVWSGENREFEDFVVRLTTHLQRLEKMGIKPANHLYEITADIDTKEGQVVTSLSTLAKNAQLHYTLDGSEPGPENPIYTNTLVVDTTTTIRAQNYLEGKAVGRGWQQEIRFHLATGHTVTLANAPHPKFNSGGPEALLNGVNGSDERYGDEEWLGFSGEDCLATIDLGAEKEISEVVFRFFKGEGQWIYLPAQVVVAASEDGTTFTEVGSLEQVTGATKVVSPRITFPAIATRYIRIEIKNFGIIPQGQQGAGNASWLFVDEISVK